MQHVQKVFGGRGHLDFGGPPVPSLGDDACGDDSEHVELRDEVRGPALGEAVVPDLLAQFPVDVVHLPCRHRLLVSCLLVLLVIEKNGVQHEF